MASTEGVAALAVKAPVVETLTKVVLERATDEPAVDDHPLKKEKSPGAELQVTEPPTEPKDNEEAAKELAASEEAALAAASDEPEETKPAEAEAAAEAEVETPPAPTEEPDTEPAPAQERAAAAAEEAKPVEATA